MKTETIHRVTFSSPGMMFSEQSTRDIAEWDAREAMRMAGTITERHGAKPFAFQFHTFTVVSAIPDGKGGFMPSTEREERKSKSHFICGRLLTLADVAREYGDDSILYGNMRGNKWPAVVETTNGYKHVAIYDPATCCLVNADGTVLP